MRCLLSGCARHTESRASTLLRRTMVRRGRQRLDSSTLQRCGTPCSLWWACSPAAAGAIRKAGVGSVIADQSHATAISEKTRTRGVVFIGGGSEEDTGERGTPSRAGTSDSGIAVPRIKTGKALTFPSGHFNCTFLISCGSTGPQRVAGDKAESFPIPVPPCHRCAGTPSWARRAQARLLRPQTCTATALDHAPALWSSAA